MKMQERSSRYRVWIGCMAAAMVTSAAVFFVMLQVEKNMLSNYEKGSVWVAVKDIPKGLMLDDRNYREYMECRELDVQFIPETGLKETQLQIDATAVYDIEAGTLLTTGMFEEKVCILDGMEQPVIAGFKADDLYQMVGGVLRSGDRINIYSVAEDGQAAILWENLYVQEVFDNSGAAVSAEDEETAVMRINVYLNAADVEKFYSQMDIDCLRVVKLCR